MAQVQACSLFHFVDYHTLLSIHKCGSFDHKINFLEKEYDYWKLYKYVGFNTLLNTNILFLFGKF
jgi:hypothetical protein